MKVIGATEVECVCGGIGSACVCEKKGKKRERAIL